MTFAEKCGWAGIGGALLTGVARCAMTALLLPDPTPEHPRVGCIADSPFESRQKHTVEGNRILPEMVRVIGVTSAEDGERWKVLRAGERDPRAWQPWEKSRIQFYGCGRTEQR